MHTYRGKAAYAKDRTQTYHVPDTYQTLDKEDHLFFTLYYRVFNLILWVLYTGMQWKCLPVPKDPHGQPAIHYTTIYKVFARWADDGSLWQAFVASVRHLAAEKQLDTSVLHGDGTNTVAKKGAMVLGTQGTNTRRVTKSSPSSTTMALS